jgi:hypothetical protein
MINILKLIMSKFGYREWELVEVMYYPYCNKEIFVCKITNKTKEIYID